MLTATDKEAEDTMKKWIKDMAEALKEAKAAERKEAIDALEKARERCLRRNFKRQ